MDGRKVLYQLPVASTEFSFEAILYGNEIRFGYVADSLERFGGIRFKRTWAKRTRSENACTVWHIDGVYDTLVEIEDSSWVAEVQAETIERQRKLGESWNMHHYMIYLDSVGCFEFLAESWESLPETLKA